MKRGCYSLDGSTQWGAIMNAAVESHGVGRKKRDEPMAAIRIRQNAYLKAKKAAELDKLTASEWLSRLAEVAADERLKLGLAEIEARDITGEIESIKANHEAEVAEVRALLGIPTDQPKSKAKGKGKPKKETPE